MTTHHPGDPARQRVTALSELPQDIAPSRDLWPAIAAQIAASPKRISDEASSRRPASRLRMLALAAVVSALAIGMWLGRSLLPPSGPAGSTPMSADAPQNIQTAAFVTSPAYLKERATLLASFEQQVRALPPESRDKVIAGLANIHKSMQDIQAALGREPGNALLQELLVNTYQDEMHVLTAVHEAGDVRKEI